jgi:hypothetical protein
MNGDIPAWLPALVLFESHGGNWERYLDAIYEIFRQDFISTAPSFRGQRLRLKKHPMTNGKEATFWHLISEGNSEADRVPDLRRCERIGWPKPVIENDGHSDIKIWTNKRGNETRSLLWIEDQDYLVVLADRKGYLLLCTAYLTTRDHTKRKLRKEYEAFRKTNAAP